MPLPTVFISSTVDDLKEHRAQAAAAAQTCGFGVVMSEDFAASGHETSLPACLKKVESAEVVVVLVAHRYGWVPHVSENPDAKSITWLECEHASQGNKKKEVLAFLIDPNYAWPAESRENYRLTREGDLPDDEFIEIRKEVRRNEKNLGEFKKELGRYFCGFFKGTEASMVG